MRVDWDDVTDLVKIGGLSLLLVLLAVVRALAWFTFRVLDHVISGLALICLFLLLVWLIAG